MGKLNAQEKYKQTAKGNCECFLYVSAVTYNTYIYRQVDLFSTVKMDIFLKKRKEEI